MGNKNYTIQHGTKPGQTAEIQFHSEKWTHPPIPRQLFALSLKLLITKWLKRYTQWQHSADRHDYNHSQWLSLSHNHCQWLSLSHSVTVTVTWGDNNCLVSLSLRVTRWFTEWVCQAARDSQKHGCHRDISNAVWKASDGWHLLQLLVNDWKTRQQQQQHQRAAAVHTYNTNTHTHTRYHRLMTAHDNMTHDTNMPCQPEISLWQLSFLSHQSAGSWRCHNVLCLVHCNLLLVTWS